MTAYGRLPDGQGIDRITLRNADGLELEVLTYGGILRALRAPDRTGAVDDILVGFDSLEGYAGKHPHFGALIGRFANRIARGRFELDGRVYTLTTNNGVNHLHGGLVGWGRAVWLAEPFRDTTGVGVRLRHRSPDGDEGYPGAVDGSVTYTLTDANELVIDYAATTDRATVVNLTQHVYFNLAGLRKNDILDHIVTIHADSYTPVDAMLIPTGEIASLDGTPLDFRDARRIGDRVDAPFEQLQHAKGYDHNYVLGGDGSLRPAVEVLDPLSGRTLSVATTEPGLQFYTGNMLDGSITGKGGRVAGFRSGLCLETQHFPDSPNHPNFPSTVLRPGQEYKSQTIFRFGRDGKG